MNTISDNLMEKTGYLPPTYRFRLFKELDDFDGAFHTADDDDDADAPEKPASHFERS